MKLYTPMPIVQFKPIMKKKSTSDKMYACPLYLYPTRKGTRERPSFQCYVDLKAGPYDSAFWLKRGTALLLGSA